MMIVSLTALLANSITGVRNFRRDRRGMAAAEFALLAPVMLTIFMGTIELSNGIAVDRKVTLTARTISDLVSQGVTSSNQDITNFFTAGTAIMSPYASNVMWQRITAVNIDGNGVAKVAWSRASNTTARAANATVTIPTGLIVNNTQLIWSEVSYTYTPAVGYVMKTALTLADQYFTRPRQSASIPTPS